MREKAPPHVLLSERQTFVLASAPNGPADVLVGLSDGDFSARSTSRIFFLIICADRS
jgi:hypothetical protein